MLDHSDTWRESTLFTLVPWRTLNGCAWEMLTGFDDAGCDVNEPNQNKSKPGRFINRVYSFRKFKTYKLLILRLQFRMVIYLFYTMNTSECVHSNSIAHYNRLDWNCIRVLFRSSTQTQTGLRGIEQRKLKLPALNRELHCSFAVRSQFQFECWMGR